MRQVHTHFCTSGFYQPPPLQSLCSLELNRHNHYQDNHQMQKLLLKTRKYHLCTPYFDPVTSSVVTSKMIYLYIPLPIPFIPASNLKPIGSPITWGKKTVILNPSESQSPMYNTHPALSISHLRSNQNRRLNKILFIGPIITAPFPLINIFQIYENHTRKKYLL